jgi:predicted XRE-type DNA-binding protein
MATKPPSTRLRAQLRERIIRRIDEAGMTRTAAGKALGLSPAQMSRLGAGQDIFSLDRLVDAAAAIGLAMRLSATRHHRHGEK